ncbi:MAG: DEAD/DEAH box helicase [Acidimicrobiales bacterium]|jgi:superfamily II DNA/RNA helicase
MAVTFADLGLAEPIVKALADQGITEPFPIQELSIPDAITGRDVCGKAKTGSGKTLAFGLPVLHQLGIAHKKKPLALALVPTRELAIQVHDELEPIANGLDRNICAIYGGADIDKQIKRLGQGVDFVVATPGRLIDLIERKEVSLDEVEHVIVDEADRMADMGFLPQVEWLLRHIPGDHQTLLFSATLDGVVDRLISRYQNDPARFEVESPTTTVDLMEHRFLLVHEMDRPKVVAAIAAASNRTLVFSRTKHGADRLVGSVNDLGVAAGAIHGDLRQKSRERALEDFSNGELQVLVATDVAARGIHVDDIDMVIHYQPAADHKAYLHRSGRTARAGNTGVAVTLSLWNEELEVKRLQKRLGLEQPVVEMFSNDERLKDLGGWEPTA